MTDETPNPKKLTKADLDKLHDLMQERLASRFRESFSAGFDAGIEISPPLPSSTIGIRIPRYSARQNNPRIENYSSPRRLDIRGDNGILQNFYPTHDRETMLYYDDTRVVMESHYVEAIQRRWLTEYTSTDHVRDLPTIERAVFDLYAEAGHNKPEIVQCSSLPEAAYRAAKMRGHEQLHPSPDTNAQDILPNHPVRRAITQAFRRELTALNPGSHPIHVSYYPHLAIHDLARRHKLTTPITNAMIDLCLLTGGVYATPRVCFVADRPAVINFDERFRLHNDKRGAIGFRDEHELYYWHDVNVPRKVILNPESMTYDEIVKAQNMEVRRAMIERYGAERFVKDSGAGMTAEDHDCRLWMTAGIDREPIVYAELINSTPEPDGSRHHYFIRVDPNAYGGDTRLVPQAAKASMVRTTSGQLVFRDYRHYRPVKET